MQIRVKPGTAEVEVDLSVDLYSENCDKEFAEKLKMTKQVDFGLPMNFEVIRGVVFLRLWLRNGIPVVQLAMRSGF